MKLLFIGDIVGEPGRVAVKALLPDLVKKKGIDCVVANAENAAGGSGITPPIARELENAGIDVLTSGDHIWKRKEIVEILDIEKRVLRPLNYPKETPGSGSTIVEPVKGIKIGVINLVGRVFMQPVECPFRTSSEEIAKMKNITPNIFVDIHAEATSEKIALGWYLDGLVTAVMGTHTHVQTADEKILPEGTAYITDVGMTGPFDSVIGRRKEEILTRFITQMPTRFQMAEGDIRLNAVIIDFDEKIGKANSIERVQKKVSMTQEKHVYTVTELTRDIRVVLEDTFGTVWVEGEVSNFTKHQSGHIYFNIRDENTTLPCVLFRRVNIGLKFEIKNGMHVLCFGKVSVYDKRGQYQLCVERIEPKGRGALQVAFEQLKEKLKKEGLFDESRKKPIPFLPQRVGVVTSPTGAAIRDIINVAKRRFSNIEIILNPAAVQGDTAKEEITHALDLFNMLKNVDVIILTRGGGSLEDLWPFNEEIVARAISRSEIPVISAVGHEIDWTISDFVADFRAPTPSAAAELVIPKKEELISILKGFSERLNNSLISKASLLAERLKTLEQSYVFREPFNIVLQYEQEIDDFAEKLILKGDIIVKLKNESLNMLAGKLGALSPLNILNRGYSITMRQKDGEIIKDASFLKERELIKTKLAKGEILSKVEEIWPKRNSKKL